MPQAYQVPSPGTVVSVGVHWPIRKENCPNFSCGANFFLLLRLNSPNEWGIIFSYLDSARLRARNIFPIEHHIKLIAIFVYIYILYFGQFILILLFFYFSFDPSQCDKSSRNFDAKPNDQISFVCANPSLNNAFHDGTKPAQTRASQLNYNIFVTEDRSVFESRNGSKATLIFNCKAEQSKNKPFYVIRKQFHLSQYMPVPMGKLSGFEPGKSYYFFSKI